MTRYVNTSDFQVALILEDEEFTEGVLNGANVKCGKLAGSLRKQLMEEHLGHNYNVEDCISDSFYKDIWLKNASKNTKLFEEIFLCIPTDKVSDMKENAEYLERRPLAEIEKNFTKEKIQEIKGNLVLLPTNYLKNELTLPGWFTKEGVVPNSTWT